MKLEEIIRQRLAEATKEIAEACKTKEQLKTKEAAVIDVEPKLEKNSSKKTMTEAEISGLSAEELKALVENKEQLDEASKKALEDFIKNKMSDEDKSDSDDKEKMSDEPEDKKVTKKLTKEDTVSSQVSALLEAEGLSDEFKTQAITIFEAAVTDRVLQIQEELQKEFTKQLEEAKAELDDDIDGFLSEAVAKWHKDNEVAIKATFRSEVSESFIDGLRSLIAEHNIDVPEDKEDALEIALSEVENLKESANAHTAELASLQEEINVLKAAQILESFKSKMTQTEYDRFVQLTETVQFVDEEKYAKQLNVVLENFGSKAKTEAVKVVEQITEAVDNSFTKVVTVDSNVAAYASFIAKK